MTAEPPLPPIPDGGLADTMPDWLRSSGSTNASTDDRPASSATSSEFSTILTDDDLPEWLRRFGDQPSGAVVSNESASSATAPRPPAEDLSEHTASRRVRIGLTPVPAATSMPLHPLPDLNAPTSHRRVPPWAIGVAVVVMAIIVIALAFG